MQEVLKDLFIGTDEIDRYFDDVAPVNLWRGKRKQDPGPIFGLIEEPITRPGGQLRPADITVELVGGVKWVRCKPSPRGISTFDKPNVFKGRSWQYYKIPKGTRIPHGLAIVRDMFNRRIGATHYSVAPARDMPLDQFKRLLNDLAQRTTLEAA